MKSQISNKKFLITFLLILILGMGVGHGASAAILYSSSANQGVAAGQTIVIDWFIDTEQEDLNLVSLKLNFTTETLEVVDLAPGDSLITLWIEPPQFSNESGTIDLTGGTAGGFNSTEFPLFRSTFLVKQSGVAQITMDESSVVLRNDGTGLPAPFIFPVLTFPVAAADSFPVEVVSETHPDETVWYQENDVAVVFVPEPDQEYSYSFSSNLELIPDENPDAVVDEDLVFEDLPDGVYYFKVNQKSDGTVWQEADIYRVQLDMTPPEEFEPVIASDDAVFGGDPFLSFSTVDKTSGVAGYRIKKGKLGGFEEAESPVKLDRPLVGDIIEVQAIDKAGNVRSIQIPHAAYVSDLVFYIGLIVIAVIILFVLIRRHRSRKAS